MDEPRQAIFVLNDDNYEACVQVTNLIQEIIDRDFQNQITASYERYTNGGVVLKRMIEQQDKDDVMLLLDTCDGLDAVDLIHALQREKQLSSFVIISNSPWVAASKFDPTKDWTVLPHWHDCLFKKGECRETLSEFIKKTLQDRLMPTTRLSASCPTLKSSRNLAFNQS